MTHDCRVCEIVSEIMTYGEIQTPINTRLYWLATEVMVEIHGSDVCPHMKPTERLDK